MQKKLSQAPINSHNLLKNNLTGVYTEKIYARYRKIKKLVSGQEFFCIGPFNMPKSKLCHILGAF